MIRIVVPGPPPRKNAGGKATIGRNRKTGKMTRIPSKRSSTWRVAFYEALTSTAKNRIIFNAGISTGVWVVRINVFEPEQRHLSCGAKVGRGDWDSCIEPVIDAMKPRRKKIGGRMIVVSPGLFDDDDRIVEGTVRKHYDKKNPRVEIELWQDAP